MTRLRSLLAASFMVAMLSASCGGSAPPPPVAPVDETLLRETHAGRLAYGLERADEAAAQYRAALARAQARDDLEAIGDLGYNLAVAELRADAPERALSAAQSTRAELERHGSQPFPALLLVEATALHRTGDATKAETLAEHVENSNERNAAARATFLRGLIADERGDVAGLAAAVKRLRLPDGAPPELQADAAELAARFALHRRAPAEAQQAAERAITLRRDTLDYRGLARALAVAGESAAAKGNVAAAAGFFLRAGRSAAAQGNTDAARLWLERASTLAPDDPAGATASALLRGLSRGEG